MGRTRELSAMRWSGRRGVHWLSGFRDGRTGQNRPRNGQLVLPRGRYAPGWSRCVANHTRWPRPLSTRLTGTGLMDGELLVEVRRLTAAVEALTSARDESNVAEIVRVMLEEMRRHHPEPTLTISEGCDLMWPEANG